VRAGSSLTVEAFIGFMGWDVGSWQQTTRPHLSAIEAVAHATERIGNGCLAVAEGAGPWEPAQPGFTATAEAYNHPWT